MKKTAIRIERKKERKKTSTGIEEKEGRKRRNY